MKVVVARQRGFCWIESEGIYVKGYLFASDELLQSEGLTRRIALIKDVEEFDRFILTANGSFAIIVNKPELHIAAVDRLRSIPLFYARGKDGTWVIGDDAEKVREEAGLELKSNHRSLKEFILTGFVIGAETLVSGLYQMRAGERLSFYEEGSVATYYYIHRGHIRRMKEELDEFDQLDIVSKKWGQRLIQSADSRPLVLPLSGGYDSRYITAVLRELEYPNLIAYTYGRPNSPEVVRSQKVAQQLDIPWYYVEYSKRTFKDFFISKSHERYCAFAHQLSSLPHYQDFIALQKLTDKGVIGSDAIIVPGFSGDLLGGSYVPREVHLGREKTLLSKGIERHIDEQQMYLKLFLRDRCPLEILDHISKEVALIGKTPDNVQDFVSLNDAFFTVHKVAKYVVHSLRVYEYFGLEWRMPLWDNELMDYWYKVPYTFRSHVNLYERYLFERPFKRLSIAIDRPQGGGLMRFHRAVSSLPFLYGYSGLLERILLRGLACIGRKNPNAFDYPKEAYLNELKAAGMPYINTINFLALFSRWLVWKYYNNNMGFSPIL